MTNGGFWLFTTLVALLLGLGTGTAPAAEPDPNFHLTESARTLGKRYAEKMVELQR